MAANKKATCRLCRREGVKLFLKGHRCVTGKCSIDRRSYKPGMHGQKRSKLSDFGVQLREKQKAKTIYGMRERQFRTYFEKAERSKGVTGEMLLQLLERRLDNVVFRCGFASSRSEARQMVTHRIIMVNDKKVDRPSYQVEVGDAIRISVNEKQLKNISEKIESLKDRVVPSWITTDTKLLTANIVRLPAKDDTGFPIQEQLIVELYSK